MNAVSSDALKIHSDEGGIKIVVSGSITERSHLVLPEEQPLGKSITLDTAGVARINSLGVANWIRFMKQLSGAGVPVTIAPLSVAFVGQARVISNFLGTARVASFVAPYFCPECDEAIERTFASDEKLPPSTPCPACKADMEFDDEYETYLEFLS